MKTIFCDIDGVLLEQPIDFLHLAKGNRACDLPGSAAKLLKWHTDGHMVILTTGRPEHMRQITEKNLQFWGIMYDQLIMGLGSGPRVLINDTDPKEPDIVKAVAINLHRNEGIEHVLL